MAIFCRMKELIILRMRCLAKYEEYRERIKTDKDCQAAFAFAEKTRCIISYERSFMQPIFK
jgi:hypothetical protein